MSKEVNQNGSFSFSFVCCGTCNHDYLGEDEEVKITNPLMKLKCEEARVSK